MPIPAPAAAALRSRMFIGGDWRDAADGRTFAVYNPATGEEIAQVPQATAEDVDAAVAAARAALVAPAWAGLTPYARERIMSRLADLIEAHADELAHLETLNQGKLLPWSHAIEVGGSAQWLRYMAGWATKVEGSSFEVSIPFPPGTKYRTSTQRVPVGVVGAIVPWNFPLAMAMWKIAPALATGCTVVLKPAEETPLTALRLAELALEAGLPPGVLNVVTGDGETAGAALVRHPGVDKISFTGSTEVGRLIGAQCGRDIRRVALELGGKSPVIVLDDVDVETAVAGAAGAIFFNHGQVCTAGSRLYVAKKLYDKVVDGLAQVADGTVLGSGFDAQAQMGPMVSARHRDRVMTLMATGAAEGGEVVAGGRAGEGPGYFVRPTVVANTANKPLTLVREEVFGPVLVAMPYEDMDSVLQQANDSAYGLGASVWTNDLRRAQRAIDALQAGTVWVNTHNMVDPAMPFGGFKSSGVGREHGRSAIEAYTELKSVCIAY
ncbi:MAG: aldehyde dehydrogenase family protein [Rhodocyclaceae bacterium]|nr:aldehyde dehydrogenase family protein [Pseudomonadota bacterium]MDQ7974095.1 aldehyde dehydrogenase family protein [Rhodocyclaceae bacterium]MDQ7999811.1 aldehyde dehydrogenase family protein [Pseudomonadota bacterium]MDQ8018241.1 aldehyde dehydrogenase family protein [Pseudomonadota bacterium]